MRSLRNSVLVPVAAYADYVTVLPGDYTGTRSVGDGITAVGCWDGTTACPSGNTGIEVDWTITDNGATWTYEYTFSGVGGVNLARGLSHWLLQVSTNFTTADITGLTGNDASISLANGDPQLYETGGPSQQNPGLPADIFAIKIDGGGSQLITFEFTSDRQPVWGNFYGKDGNNPETFAYNSGFMITPSSTMTDFTGYIPTPDTFGHQVPEPASLLLLGTGLLGLGFMARRKMAK